MGENERFLRCVRNPAFGLIPMLVFSILVMFVDTWIAMSIGLALSLIGSSFIKRHSRMLYDISAITFAFAFIMQVIYPTLDVFGKFVLTEIIFVVVLIVSRLTRSKVVLKLTKNNKVEVKNYLSESFRVAFQTQYSLFFHLMLILFYLIISSIRTSLIDMRHIVVILQIIFLSIIVLEIIRLRLLDKKLNHEEWLPVVSESGDVTGRVAKSVTKTMKNKYLHPVVRIALINKGRIYLTQRDSTRLLNPGKLDYPFEKYLQYNHDINKTIQNIIKKEIGAKEIPLHFLLKYIFENEETKRLILLYVSIVDDDDDFNRLHLREGKLWTTRQIEDNKGQNLFSECFELEFEYLKNTVLLNYHQNITESQLKTS